MKYPRNAKIFRGQLDAAPFAGMLFVLLIFLWISSKLALTPGVRIDLPSVTDPVPGIGMDTVAVAVDSGGNFYFEGRFITEEDLRLKLKQRLSESTEPLVLEVQPDRSGKLEAAVQLLNSAHALGFKQALIRVRPPMLPIPADGSQGK